MRLTPKIAGITLAVLALGGTAAGTAFASVNTGKSAPAITSTPEPTSTSPDTDTLQQGDQTTPDAPGKSETEKAGAEKAGTETEKPGASDGPGGHADPAGNAQHQGTGTE